MVGKRQDEEERTVTLAQVKFFLSFTLPYLKKKKISMLDVNVSF